MLKIVRTTALALALFSGPQWLESALAARHVSGTAYGARPAFMQSSRWFSARHRHGAHSSRRWRHWARRAGHGAIALRPAPGRPLELHPLLAVARRYVGSGRISHQGGPWCRDFVNKVVAQAGYRLANHSRRAIDALRLGHRVGSPRPGDLVVMRHHVTIFAGFGGRGLIGLGGNQGHGRVTYSSFSRGRVLGYVRM